MQMTYLTAFEICSAINWEKKPTTQLYMLVADYVNENLTEINEMIQEALSQGKSVLNIDPNNSITIN